MLISSLQFEQGLGNGLGDVHLPIGCLAVGLRGKFWASFMNVALMAALAVLFFLPLVAFLHILHTHGLHLAVMHVMQTHMQNKSSMMVAVDATLAMCTSMIWKPEDDS